MRTNTRKRPLRPPSKFSHPWPLRTRHSLSSPVLNSLEKLSELAARHGNTEVLKRAGKASALLSRGMAPDTAFNESGLADANVQGMPTLKDRLKRTQQAMKRTNFPALKEAAITGKRIQSFTRAVSKARNEQSRTLATAAEAYGIRPEAVKRIRLPPFVRIHAEKEHYPFKPLAVIKPHIDVRYNQKMNRYTILPTLVPNFSNAYNLNLFLKPAERFFGRRTITISRARVASSDSKLKDKPVKLAGPEIGFAQLAVVNHAGEKVMVIGSIQTGPMFRPITRWPYHEFKDYGKLLFLKALDFAKKNKVDRVVLANEEYQVQRWGFNKAKPGMKSLRVYKEVADHFDGRRVTVDFGQTETEGFHSKIILPGYEWRLTKKPR